MNFSFKSFYTQFSEAFIIMLNWSLFNCSFLISLRTYSGFSKVGTGSQGLCLDNWKSLNILIQPSNLFMAWIVLNRYFIFSSASAIAYDLLKIWSLN